MAISYRDGSFSEVMEFSEAHEKFLDAVEVDEAKAFFVGSEQEVKSQIEKAKSDSRLDELEDRIKSIESDIKGPIKPPTFQELQKYSEIRA